MFDNNPIKTPVTPKPKLLWPILGGASVRGKVAQALTRLRQWTGVRTWFESAHAALRSFIFSLSGRLILLTLVFVAVVEVIIIIPSMASYQELWLSNRIAKAEIASLALDASEDKAFSKGFSRQLLRSTGVLYLAIQNDGVRDYVFREPNIVVPDEVIDLRLSHTSLKQDLFYLWAPWKTIMSPDEQLIHYQAKPRVSQGQLIEIVVPIAALKDSMWTYLISILRMSLGISFAAGLVVYYALSFFIIRPIERLTSAITVFRQNPEAIPSHNKPSGRSDEIGHIESELISMQDEVRTALRSKARLAALGQAVSKINHDLRNMLTSAQMASDRLARLDDPAVTKALPRLERALDRALALAQNVLNYGRSDEREPKPQILVLRDLAYAAAEDAGLSITKGTTGAVRFNLKAPRGFHFEADPEHMHRLLVNLMRNARQAIELQPNRKALGRVILGAEKSPKDVIITISDNGPGIAAKTREKLFQPFNTSSTPGGSGLGLAIARELAQLHGGDVILRETGAGGTVFEIRLPIKA